MTAGSDVSPRTIVALAIAVLALAALRLMLPPPTHTSAPETPTATGEAPHTTGGGRSSTAQAAVAAARGFLDAHVTGEGRVVRHDQGGDTVSEGQAWALVLAVALGERERATAIVDWTETHLARDDGMLAWRWDQGRPVDTQPATDADLVYAWALARGAAVFERDDWQRRAEELVARLASTSLIPTEDGPVLAAGPWAREQAPSVVNPSYLWDAPLAWAAGQDGAFHGTREATRALLQRLVRDDTPLVPDWVTVDEQGSVTAIGSPSDPGAPPRHGLDAVRTWIWSGSSCDPHLRRLAARAHAVLPRAGQQMAGVHDLSGSPTVDWPHAATLSGAAAAAHAAGDTEAARRRLNAATRLDRASPSYYGAAVTALARMLLDTDLIVACDD